MPEARTEIKGRKWVKPRYAPRRKVCMFCKDKVKVIDYKDAEKLRGFISDRSKIEPRRKTGTCSKHQRLLATAIKRARHLALLPVEPIYGRGSEARPRFGRFAERPPVAPPAQAAPTQTAPAEAAPAEPQAPPAAS